MYLEQPKLDLVCFCLVDYQTINSRIISGKTLAFLIPILENLIQADELTTGKKKTKKAQYLSALVLAPTRELVMVSFFYSNCL